MKDTKLKYESGLRGMEDLNIMETAESFNRSNGIKDTGKLFLAIQ